MSEWYEIDASWDATGNASDALLKLGYTREWCELVEETSMHTCATADQVWDGMAKALRGYLESLDKLTAFMPNNEHAELRGDAE